MLTRPASAAPAASNLAVTSVGGNPAVVLPTGYDIRRFAGDPAELRRLTRAAVAAVESSRVVRGNSAETEAERDHLDSVVLFVDAAGNVVRPDAERARSAASVAARDLSFTFESPAHPFTSEQIAAMRAWIGDFYPVIKGLYGPPAFTNTVNVSYDPTISVAGYYSAGSNEIVVGDPSEIDVLVHEIIHAFHDDDMIVSQWEETLTRAAEIAAFNQLGNYPHWDAHHSYYHDIWVDALDAQPSIGSTVMNIWDGFPNALVRYNVGGYEWWKVFHARPAFFSNFNRMLYTHPDWVYQEAALVEMAAAAAPTVEGMPFPFWYVTRGVFNSAPPLGYQFFLSGQSGYAWLFNRFSDYVSPTPGVTVSWQTQAADGRVLAAGSTTTSPNGAVIPEKDQIPGTYAGRALLTVTATVETETVTASTWLSSASGDGIFGIAPTVRTGSVTLTNLEDPAAPAVTVPLVKGVFDAPSLATAVGRFRAILTRPDGTVAARRVFTKDASPYLVMLEARPAPVVNLETAAVDAPATVLQGAEMSPAVTVKNLGPSTAPPSSSRLLLSKDSTPDAGDIQSLALARLPAIASGAQVQASTTFPVPATTAPGTYRLLSCTDDNQLIPESNETDNCLAGPTVTVVAPAPNLSVVSVRTPPSAAQLGTTFTAGDTTRNLGQLSAPASSNRYLLSHDKTRGASDVVLTPRRQLASLAPGADSGGSVNVTIPPSTPTGAYWVLACADDTHVVTESDEADNCRASKAQINIGP